MRCLVIKDLPFYIKLYQTLVVLRLTYCCETWRPYLKKDKLALDRIRSRFLRQVALRRGIDTVPTLLKDLNVIFDTADRNMFSRLKSQPCFEVLFRKLDSGLRMRRVPQPFSRATTDEILNMFVWRVCRQLCSFTSLHKKGAIVLYCIIVIK